MPSVANRLAGLGKVLPVLRASTSEHVLGTVDAIVRSGLRSVEITMTTPDALGLIRRCKANYGEALRVGAGTVLEVTSAREAVAAGAEFLVTPTWEPEVVRFARESDVIVFCGAFTPTEIWGAWAAGADAIKIFPARIGGPHYISDLLAPMPDLLLAPSGGVRTEDVSDYLAAGAVAAFIGSQVVGPALNNGDYSSTERQCRQLLRDLKASGIASS